MWEDTALSGRNLRDALARRWPLLVGIALVTAIAVGIAALRDNFQKPAQPKKQVQQITMIAPPPPPPPPPAPPPPPEEVQQKIEEPAPDPEPAPEAAPAELGLDADGTAGSDGFGLAARKGGQALIGGGSGNAIIWYGQKVSSAVADAVREGLDAKAKNRKFQALLNVWLDENGALQRVELAAPTGDKEVDAALARASAELRLQLALAPPVGMPQPVKIRIDNR